MALTLAPIHASTKVTVTPSSFPHFFITLTLPRASFQPRYGGDKKKHGIAASNSALKFNAWTARSLSKRLLLYVGFVPVLSIVNLAIGAPIPQMEDPEIIRTRKLSGGVRVQGITGHHDIPLKDIVDGEGPEANEGDVVVFNYVCRRSNGYFVYSTVDQFTGEAMPVTLPLDEKQIIKGLKDVLTGMKVGGKRRALIPPSMGYVNENMKPIPEEFGPQRSLLSHANEPLIFEK